MVDVQSDDEVAILARDPLKNWENNPSTKRNLPRDTGEREIIPWLCDQANSIFASCSLCRHYFVSTKKALFSQDCYKSAQLEMGLSRLEPTQRTCEKQILDCNGETTNTLIVSVIGFIGKKHQCVASRDDSS